jgi:hypothetical protein
MSHFVAKRHTTSKITLSWLTFGRRTEKLTENTEGRLKMKTNNFHCFCTNRSKHRRERHRATCVLICGVDVEFSRTGISCLNANERATTCAGFYKQVKIVQQCLTIAIQNLMGLVTNGAPSTFGMNSGVSSLITIDLKNKQIVISYVTAWYTTKIFCAYSLKTTNVGTNASKFVNFVK